MVGEKRTKNKISRFLGRYIMEMFALRKKKKKIVHLGAKMISNEL